MNSLKDITEYRSVWEQVENIPAGLPLRRRSTFPDYLSTEEIASLLFEFADEEEIGQHLLNRAVQKGELRAKVVMATYKPADPLAVIKNLYSHIRIIEDKFQGFQKDITSILQKKHKRT